MSRLFRVRHETLYTYEKPVGFRPHRLMLRPRDSHAIRVLEASMALSPGGETRWMYDALGNCVCWFQPEGQANELRIASNLLIDRYPSPLEPLSVADPHTASPIVYSQTDRAVLEPFIRPASDDPDGRLLRWVHSHMGSVHEPVIDFLQRVNGSIHQELAYAEREEEGAQAPGDTLRLGGGSCRDYAWLMIEALRRLGFAARYIMGYLYSPGQSTIRGAGATHAWCEVFLPELGWMEFDPTNGLAESADLIRVATVRTPQEASPATGHIVGDPGRRNLSASVEVDLEEPPSSAEAA